jgi:hypothetical protein
MPTVTRTRFRVDLNSRVAARVQKLAQGEDLSISKTIETLVMASLQERARKRRLVYKLNQNVAYTDAGAQGRMVDEFRALILGQFRLHSLTSGQAAHGKRL